MSEVASSSLSSTYFPPGGRERRIGIGIETEHGQAETLEQIGKNDSDFSRADESDGFTMQVKTQQAVDREIAGPDAVIRAMNAAIERQNQSEGNSATA